MEAGELEGLDDDRREMGVLAGVLAGERRWRAQIRAMAIRGHAPVARGLGLIALDLALLADAAAEA